MTCSCCEPSLETPERAICPVDGSNGVQSSGRGLVCYCFGILESQIVEEVRTMGTSSTGDFVQEQVRAGNCVCEVKNPSGKCCLKDLKALVGDTQRTRKESG